VVSAVVSGPGALRRSLVVWGWGQVAAGDRRGAVLPAAQAAAIAALVALGPYAVGVTAPLVYLAGALVLTAWALVAAHAWRRAARRRAALGAGPGGGAAGLLWLTPVAVVLGAGFWILAGSGADPGLTLDGYLADWRAGRAEAAADRLAGPLPAPALREAWSRQEAALRNAVVRILAEAPTAEADPDRLLDGLRWTDLGSTASGGRSFAVEIARQETVREQVFGLLPATARRLVTVERLGVAELRRQPIGPEGELLGPVLAWRLVDLEIAGERLVPASGAAGQQSDTPKS
jgi:hypothetical protein